MRLREEYLDFMALSKVISIPSGAIKSGSGNIRTLTNSQISIPSGAIKRTLRRRDVGRRVQFQFLLVRLRVKSVWGFSDNDIEFQFLLVRLRDTPS